MIEIAEPEDYVERSLEILKEVKENSFLEQKGIAPILTALGEEDISEDVFLEHRSRRWRAISAAGLRGKGCRKRCL